MFHSFNSFSLSIANSMLQSSALFSFLLSLTRFESKEINYTYTRMLRSIVNPMSNKHQFNSSCCLIRLPKFQVRAEKVVVEANDIAKGLVELIAQHGIATFVMGAAADKHFSKYGRISSEL